MNIVRKQAAAAAGPDMEFVLSDETVDRMGDVIVASGWDLKWFRRNPIALFGHSGGFPIGKWADVRVEGGRLLGRLKFAAEGTSARIDELRRLVEQGVLRAVSVGFRPLADEPINEKEPYGGRRYTRQELVECSLVSVPANPAALAVARGLKISDDVLQMAFGETAKPALARRGLPGEPAAPSNPSSKRITMKTMTQRIEEAQAALLKAQDALNAQVDEDDADPEVTDTLAAEVERRQKALTSLQRAEQALMRQAEPVKPAAADRKPFAAAARKAEPREMFLRAAVCHVLAHQHRRSPYQILNSAYDDDENVKIMLDVVSRAASAPATTTGSGWADTLVQTAFLDFLETLTPMAIYPKLRDRGGKFSFGMNGVVSIPARNTANSLAGSFVAQGAPIPVRQGGFTGLTLTPKKMAVITTMTREIAMHSTPAIEGLLRDAIQEDTATAIDAVLLDATAASTTRPAGLRNGVTGLTATAGGDFGAVVGDLKGLVGALITSSAGNLRAPVFIMNPVQALSLSLVQNNGGDFPFAADLGRGQLQGYPVLQSATVTAGTVFLVDAADFFSATGDEPRFEVTDQATLHMEDTTPLAIGTAGTPNTVAAPVRSLWQTDSIGLRMIMDLNWTMRRSGCVAYVTSVTW